MKSILIVTDVELGPENHTGPSSLMWEIETFIRGRTKKDYKCTVVSTRELKRGAIAACDMLLVYPQHLLLKIPVVLWPKAIVLGPDSCVLLFSRFIKSKNVRITGKIRYVIALTAYLFFELCMLLLVKKIWLVGRLDLKTFAFGLGGYSAKVCYLTHPFNSTYTRRQRPDEKALARRIIMFGDLQSKYVWNTPELISAFSSGDNLKVLITGRRNKWLADKLRDCRILDIEFVEWVEDFSELCGERDVHFFPLAAGAGTKNRVLGSLQFNVPIIASPIALENIADDAETRIKLGVTLWQGEALDMASVTHGDSTYIRAFIEQREIAFQSDIEKELCIGDT